ncbi:5094_t:CDS:2, partial [Paraglomus occultum]
TKIDNRNASQAVMLEAEDSLLKVMERLNIEVLDERHSSVRKSFGANVRLFIYVPSAPKRKAEEPSMRFISTKKAKEWHVNSTIYPGIRPFYYYADQTERNRSLIEQIAKGQFMRMYGPRASGKSSRVWQAMEQLASLGYECIYATLEDATIRDEQSFWVSLNQRFGSESRLPAVIDSSDSFREAFDPRYERWNRPVVIFLDEFDKLHDDDAADACSSVLSTIRGIRNDRKTVIHSINTIGTFAILELDQTRPSLSPFNATENFDGVSLAKEQVYDLYNDYSKEHKITIEPAVIEDIYDLTSGRHAGLVCLCGRAIHRELYPDIDAGTKVLSFETWTNFADKSLQNQITGYATFRKLIDTLTKEKYRDAMNFLRTYFVGNSDDFVPVRHLDHRRLASFLAAQGVLQSSPQDESASAFKMSSPLIDGLIRQVVIPAAYPNCPNLPIPKENGSLDIIGILKEAIKFFDKDLITLAPETASKVSKDVRVNGLVNQLVPRESVYDSETLRILMNWLDRQHNYTVVGQWTIRDPKLRGDVQGSRKVLDIVIQKTGTPTIVLEFLATGYPDFIKQHINIGKAPIYQKRVSADASWVIHFTRQDGYLDKTKPIWQSDEALNMGVNLVHIWHDANFTTARMGARWKDADGNVQQINNEVLTV